MSVYRGCDIPGDLFFDVDRDVWIRPAPDGTLTLMLTLTRRASPRRDEKIPFCGVYSWGKVLHILFKKPGRHLDAGQSAATIETAKWAGPFPTPVSGTIAETNEATFRADILIANRDPYGAGWIVRLEPDEWAPEAQGLVTGEAAVQRYETRIDELGLNCFRCAD